MNDAKTRIISRIRDYRRHERLLFRQCVDTYGVNDRALQYLDNMTHSHQDEHMIKKTRSPNEVRHINQLYPAKKL